MFVFFLHRDKPSLLSWCLSLDIVGDRLGFLLVGSFLVGNPFLGVGVQVSGFILSGRLCRLAGFSLHGGAQVLFFPLLGGYFRMLGVCLWCL